MTFDAQKWKNGSKVEILPGKPSSKCEFCGVAWPGHDNSKCSRPTDDVELIVDVVLHEQTWGAR